MYYPSDPILHQICELQGHQGRHGGSQEDLSGDQRGRGHERADRLQGTVGKNVSQLRAQLGGELGYSFHVFRISGRGAKDNIHDEYYRGSEPAVPQDHQEQAVLHKRRFAEKNPVSGVEKHCRTLDSRLSKLGHGFGAATDPIL